MQFLFVSTCLGIHSEIGESDPSDKICWRVCSNGLSHRPAPMGISQVRILSRTAELEIGIRSEIGFSDEQWRNFQDPFEWWGCVVLLTTVHSSYRGGQSYSSAFLTMPNVIYTVIQKGSQFFDGTIPKMLSTRQTRCLRIGRSPNCKGLIAGHCITNLNTPTNASAQFQLVAFAHSPSEQV